MTTFWQMRNTYAKLMQNLVLVESVNNKGNNEREATGTKTSPKETTRNRHVYTTETSKLSGAEVGPS